MRHLLIAILVYMLCDQGLANVLDLRTLRHGTCWRNWLLIRMHGADPAQGGKAPGEAQLEGTPNCEGAFFVYDDETQLTKRIGPRRAAIKSTKAWWPHPLAALVGFLTPALKFRFTAEEAAERFQTDELTEGALYTTEPVGITHLGITGSIIQGYRHPIRWRTYRPVLGFLQLGGALILTFRKRGMFLIPLLLISL